MPGIVKHIRFDAASKVDSSAYPYSLAVVRALMNRESLSLHPRVTFLVGENGSGKSTLTEAVAVAAGFNAEGGTRNFGFDTFASHSDLHLNLRLARGARRLADGFFLRAESLFNVASEIEALDQEPSFDPPIIDSYGGVSLHKQSHGESFLAVMRHRFHGDGFYVLDEPEAALSPQRQLALIALIHQLTNDGAQFVIATHSPMLMSYPHSTIFVIGEDGIHATNFDDVEHVRLTREFLKAPDRYLRTLMDPGPQERATDRSEP